MPVPGFKDCRSEMEVRTWYAAHEALFLLVEPLDCDSLWQLMSMSHLPAFMVQQELVAARDPGNSARTLNAATTVVLLWNFSSFGQVDLTGSSLPEV